MDDVRIPPAGDPFTSAPAHPSTDETPHACLEGVVYIGRLVVAVDGGEAEVIEAVPCRRCAGEDR